MTPADEVTKKVAQADDPFTSSIHPDDNTYILTSKHGHGEPSPTWIPAANEVMRGIAAAVDGFPLSSVGELADIPMPAHFLVAALRSYAPGALRLPG